MTTWSPAKEILSVEAVNPAKRKFRENPIVTILVGENKTLFQIHVDQLCEVSSFFKAAFQGEFRESSEMKMDLPEDDENVFDLFVQWVYYRRYEIPPNAEPRFLEPVKLYVLADKYDVGDLKSLLITKLFASGKQKGQKRPNRQTVAYAFQHTSQNSSLRRLLADWYVCKRSISWFGCEVAQQWLQEHPELALAMISSFAMAASKAKLISPFDGEMPERYLEQIEGDPQVSNEVLQSVSPLLSGSPEETLIV